MRKLANEIALDDEVFATLKDKLQDQVLMFETGGKHMAAAKQRTQEKQVEENILLLKVNQIKKAKKKEEKNIYNLQKFRLELETVRPMLLFCYTAIYLRKLDTSLVSNVNITSKFRYFPKL